MRMPDGCNEVILIRHGNVARSDEDPGPDARGNKRWPCVGGEADDPLDETGRLQAHVARLALRDTPIDDMVTSPQVRAVETATTIINGRSLELQISNDLRERDMGDAKAATLEDFQGDPEGWEPHSSMRIRAHRALERYACRPGRVAALATHGGIIRTIGGLAEVKLEAGHLCTGAIIRLKREGSGWKVIPISLTVFLAVSQDVETAVLAEGEYGPENTEFSLNSCNGFRNLVARWQLPVTRLVHREQLASHAEMIRAEREAGHAHGIHSHPWKNQHFGYRGQLSGKKHIGSLTEAELAGLMKWNAEPWADEVGFEPHGFRSGDLSASPTMYKVLAESGIRWTSCAAVGRRYPRFDAVWTGAEPYAHRTSATSHLTAGSLELVEVPVSVDRSVEPVTMADGAVKYPDLSPDNEWETKYGIRYATIIRNIIRQLLMDAPPVLYLALLTHNHKPYSDPEAPASMLVAGILSDIHDIGGSLNIMFKGATIPWIADIERARSNPLPYLTGGGGLELSTIPREPATRARKVLITGGNRGIGLAIAEEYLAQGYLVCVGVRNVDESRHQFSKWGTRVHVGHFDAFNNDTVKTLVAGALQAFDGRSLDFLVNNAGHSEEAVMEQWTSEALRRHYVVNVQAPMLLTTECLPHLNKSGSGRLIYLSSMSGIRVLNEFALYNITKAGVIALAESMRVICWREKKGVRVATICPGFVDTSMSAYTDQVKGEEMTQPMDVASIIRFITELPNTAEMPLVQIRCKYYPRH